MGTPISTPPPFFSALCFCAQPLAYLMAAFLLVAHKVDKVQEIAGVEGLGVIAVVWIQRRRRPSTQSFA